MMQSIRAFVAVASAGSFTAAAQNMKVGTPQVSRAIADIEAHLSLRLLNRTTRSVALTTAGERYLVHCRSILVHLEQAEAEAAGLNAMPVGTLRIGVDPAFDRSHLISVVSDYRDQHPQVSVQVDLAQGAPEVVLSNHDAVLLCDLVPERAGLVLECLGAASAVLCASPVYLASHGVPRTPADLQTHKCLQRTTMDHTSGQWQLQGPDGPEAFRFEQTSFGSDLADMLIDATVGGLGIGLLPVAKALPDLRRGALVQVLPRYRLAAQNIHVAYPSAPYADARIRTWIEFLRKSLPPRLASDQAAFGSFAGDWAGTVDQWSAEPIPEPAGA